MAKKKKEEPIVIQNTELIPTTIGVLDTKENGPLFAIVWIIIFVGGIFALPYLNTWIQNKNNPEFSGSKTEKPSTPTTPENPEKEIQYYGIVDGLVINYEGFQITNIVVNESTKQLNFRIVNISGASNLFQNRNHYVELYSDQNTLLQRSKINNQMISTYSNYTFDITTSIQNGTISKMAIVLKDVSDYPQVSLRKNDQSEPILTCTNPRESYTYIFEEKNDLHSLKRIESSFTYSSSQADYETILANYTTLVSSYENVNGVSAKLTPVTNGFSYESSVDLGKISVSDLNRLFDKKIYYSKDTEAKVIAFELETSGFTCN